MDWEKTFTAPMTKKRIGILSENSYKSIRKGANKPLAK